MCCAAPCPRCGACVSWREPEIACFQCGAEWELTPQQANDFTLARLGVTNTRLARFLQAIDREGRGPTPLYLPPIRARRELAFAGLAALGEVAA
jgi:hypothetical protein